MTVATTLNTTATIDEDIITDLAVEFDGFRSRIATMSVEASGTLTSMFAPLGPADSEGAVIDLSSIEFEQVALELVPAAA